MWGAGNQACESHRGSSLQVTQLYSGAGKGWVLADERVSHHWGYIRSNMGFSGHTGDCCTETVFLKPD